MARRQGLGEDFVVEDEDEDEDLDDGTYIVNQVMIKTEDKTKKQLLNEFEELRSQVDGMKKLEVNNFVEMVKYAVKFEIADPDL